MDAQEEHETKEAYRIHRVIDVPVTRFSIDPPRSFTLYFENDLHLTVFDDSDQYRVLRDPLGKNERLRVVEQKP